MYKLLSTQIDESGNTNYGQDAPIFTEIDIDFNQTPNIIGY